MSLLNREGLFAALALRHRDVVLPDGSSVRVRTMTVAERMDISAKAVDASGKNVDTGKFSALIVAATVVDEDGKRVFTDEDVQQLLSGASDVFGAILEAAQELNGMGARQVEAAKGN